MQSSLTSKFLSFLRSKGIEYNRDSDGDYSFFYQGNLYYYIVYPNSELPYFRMQQFLVDDASEHLEASLRACSCINESIKVIKAYIDKHNNVTFSIEGFIPKGSSNLDALFERFFSIFADAADDYLKEKDNAIAKVEDSKPEAADAPTTVTPELPDIDFEGLDLQSLAQLLPSDASQSSATSTSGAPDPDGLDLETYRRLADKQ